MKNAMQFEVVNAHLVTPYGEFRLIASYVEHTCEPIFALVHGGGDSAPLVRIHSQCLTGDVFRSLRCDCGLQLGRALELIGAAEYGILIYQMQEGRGIGLMNKLRAYELQDQGLDTVDANLQLGFLADHRTYGVCAAVLQYLGAGRIRLLSNNPGKIEGLESNHIHVVERIPLHFAPSSESERYIRTKQERLGHLFGV
jgi:3,4-dihydroxy 2-butanone 4-phosphate synthase/GTP cyclohydrolase II